MRFTTTIILFLVAILSQGCVTANTWTSNRARIVSQPEGTSHKLVVEEELYEAHLFYRGGPGVKIQKYQARKAPFFVDNYTGWDYWWAFPVTAPLDVCLFVLSSPYACVQKALSDTGDREIGPPQELKKGETLPAYIPEKATLTYPGLREPIVKTLYNSYKNKYGASFGNLVDPKLELAVPLTYRRPVLITYENMIATCLKENRQEAEFQILASGMRFRQIVPLPDLLKTYCKLLDEPLKKMRVDRFITGTATRLNENWPVTPETPDSVKAAITALKKRLKDDQILREKRAEKLAIQLAASRAKEAALKRKAKILEFYQGVQGISYSYKSKNIVQAGDYELLVVPLRDLPRWAVVYDGRWIAKGRYRGKKKALPAIATVEYCRKLLPCSRCKGTGKFWNGKYNARSTTAKTRLETVRVVDSSGRSLGLRREYVTSGGGTQFSKAMKDCPSCDALGISFK